MILARHIALLLLAFAPLPAYAEGRPVVLELFTSQGCSSCPKADALLLELAKGDLSFLPLSYHVHYWDRLGWKDPFSSAESTSRQQAYRDMHNGRMYTPQLIVEGAASAIGSNRAQVGKAIAFARESVTSVPVTLKAGGATLDIRVGSAKSSTGTYIPENATVYAVQFRPYAKTSVTAGENSGKTMESVNSVIRITPLGTWEQQEAHFTLPLEGLGGDGVAVLVQAETQGRIIGAARYLPD